MPSPWMGSKAGCTGRRGVQSTCPTCRATRQPSSRDWAGQGASPWTVSRPETISLDLFFPKSGLPALSALAPNYPNPFNCRHPASSTAWPTPGPVRLEVYNVLGQRVRTLVEKFQNAGSYQVHWDARDQGGTRGRGRRLCDPPAVPGRGADAAAASAQVALTKAVIGEGAGLLLRSRAWSRGSRSRDRFRTRCGT